MKMIEQNQLDQPVGLETSATLYYGVIEKKLFNLYIIYLNTA